MQSEIQISLKYSLVDESYTNNMVQDGTLLTVIEEDRFSFSLLDNDRQKMVLLKDYRLINTSSQAINLGDFFTKVYETDADLQNISRSKTVLSIYSPCSVLVPTPLFLKEKAKTVLEQICAIDDTVDIMEDHIFDANAYHIFSVSRDLLKSSGDAFKQATLFHAGSAFIESQIRLNKHQKEPVVSINVRTKSFDMVVSNGSNLILHNTFPFETSEDLIYYILFTLEQLGLNPDSVTVRFYGEIDKMSSSWLVSKKYIRNVEFGNWLEGLDFSYGFDQVNPHQYYALFSQSLCV